MSQIKVARQRTSLQVVGLGALNIDHIYQVDLILGDGETADTPRYRESELKPLGKFPGGSAANTIYGLAKLGIRTGFIGAVGDDAEGQLSLRDLEQVAVDISQIKVKAKAKTGVATCLSDKLNFRSIRVSPGANSRLTIADIDWDYLNQAEIVHISSFVADAQWEALLALANKLDSSVKISFSPGALYAARGLKTLTPLLARTEILFINESEMRQLTGEDFSSGAQLCLKLGCDIVAVTLGQGTNYKTRMATSYIRNRQREYVVEPVNKEIIADRDTIGAGDAFATGFLYGLLNSQPLDECGRLGDIVARCSLRQTGARAGLPSLEELSQHYRELYHREL